MRTLLLLTVLTSATLPAQDKPTRTIYKVDFVIRDSGGTTPYKLSMLVEDQNGTGTVRTGTRVPVILEAIDGKGGAGRKTDYVDVGLNLDCRVQTVEGLVRLNADVEMSSLRKPEAGYPGSAATPAVSSLRTHVNTGLKPGQPAVVARVDDSIAKRSLEIEATATPVN